MIYILKKIKINNKKRNIIIFLIILLISCVIFKEFLNMHYATDTYNIIDRGYKEYAIKYSLNDGRLFMSIISLLANKFNIPIVSYIISLTFLAIFVSCISVIVIKDIIEQYKGRKNFVNDVVLTLICYCTIFNFMFLENMQFAECFVMAISILLDIIGANILTEENPKYLIKSSICIVFRNFILSGNIRMFCCYDISFFYN